MRDVDLKSVRVNEVRMVWQCIYMINMLPVFLDDRPPKHVEDASADGQVVQSLSLSQTTICCSIGFTFYQCLKQKECANTTFQ